MQFFDRYDWRTKNRILWGAAILFLLASYQLAIRPTLGLREEYNTLQAGETARQVNIETLTRLRAKTQQAGQLFETGGNDADTTASLSEPERIALMAQQHGVSVRSLPAPELLGTETLHVFYTEYHVEGPFTGLLQLLHDAERQQGVNLLSAAFVKQPNPTTRMPELLLQLRTVRVANE